MIKDSGNRREFSTGSHRDVQKGKGRYDLLPLIALRALAIHYEEGAEKYTDHNWRKGQPLCESFINSAKRHLDKWIMCWDDENHLIAATWNILCAYETLEMIKRGKLPVELDDRLEDYKDDYQHTEGRVQQPTEEELNTMDDQLPEHKQCESCECGYLVINGKSYMVNTYRVRMSIGTQCPCCDEWSIKI